MGLSVDIHPHENFNYLDEFARRIGAAPARCYLKVPESIGDGFVKRITIDRGVRVLIHNYCLNEDFTIRRLAADQPSEILTFRFISRTTAAKERLSNVQLLTSQIAVEDRIPAGERIVYVIVNLSKEALLSLSELSADALELQSVFQPLDSMLLYQEPLTPSMSALLQELSKPRPADALEGFYCKLRVFELLYLLLKSLFQRDRRRVRGVHRQDVERIFAIENRILADLSRQPNLSTLALDAGMSGTKMKSLFKNIFGTGIYEYYQRARMAEAALLLRNNKGLSVSDVGYQLGFSNLSHFSRLFKRFTGLTPKAYSTGWS